LIEALNQISLLVGIWIAIYGINAWKNEHIGRRNIDLAEDSLALFYEAADAIRFIRQPFSFPSETDSVVRNDNESEREFDARKNASVVFIRFNQHQELFSKIYATRYRFMARIGKDKAKPFEDLNKISKEIKTAARVLARYWPRDYFRTEAQLDDHQGRVDKYESVFWDHGDDDDINTRLDNIITEMEIISKTVIDQNNGLLTFLTRTYGKAP